MVLTGAGERTFCAGRDLKEVEAMVASAQAGATPPRPTGGFGGMTQGDFSKPIIAAVNGFAMGGGFEICLACDLIVAEEHASFGPPEVKRGLFAGAGGLVRIGKRLPMPLAMEMVLTGEPLSAQRSPVAEISLTLTRGQGSC